MGHIGSPLYSDLKHGRRSEHEYETCEEEASRRSGYQITLVGWLKQSERYSQSALYLSSAQKFSFAERKSCRAPLFRSIWGQR